MTHPNGTRGFIEFCYRVGIVAGAAIAVATLASMSYRMAMAPLIANVAQESMARRTTDSLIVLRLDDIGTRVQTNTAIIASRRRPCSTR